MPHQCVRCNTFYDDGATEILQGCKCGSKLFFFIRKEALEKAKEVQEKFEDLSQEEKKQVEHDVLNIVGADGTDTPVVLDIEAIRIPKPGKFEIDLVHLFDKDNPLIYKLGDGKYVIDLSETLKRRNELKDSENKEIS